MPRSNYYQAGDNYGRAGNYAYQAGGIFGSIGKALKGAIGLASNIVPGGGLVRTGLKIAGGLLGGAAAGRAVQAAFPAAIPSLASQVPVPGLRGFGQRLIPGGASGFISGRRRMNPMNVKALRRASRRLDSFAKTARKALRHSPFMLVSRASRAGRGGSRGVITRSEAARALKR